jgi:hypothetical protein
VADGGWLRRHLTEQGYLDEAGIGRRLQLRRHSCDVICAVALNGRIAAFTEWVDTEAIGPAEERRLWAEGVSTYVVHKDCTIHPRYWAWSQPTELPVVRRHSCPKEK